MAKYDITQVNGITKEDIGTGFVYHLPLEIITTNTINASFSRTKRGETDVEYVQFSLISDKLGASTVEEYADQICFDGNYTLPPPPSLPLPAGASTEANQDLQITESQTANSYLSSLASDARQDAFGRYRVSNTQSLIDLKQLNDGLDLFFDSETIGTGATAYQSGEASTRQSVSANNDVAIRQTKQRFNYQTGKSQLIECTFANMQAETDVTKRLGYFSSNQITPFDSDKDGLWLETSGGTAKVVQSKSGTATAIEQVNWNIDKLDGTGESGITIDLSKSQILVIDFQWLGVGRVRFGFSINGALYYAHEFRNANNLLAVYISSPTQPIRYEIRSTGGAAYLDQICSTVQSEGGQTPLGVIRGVSSAIDMQCSILLASYAIYGIRLKAGYYADINLLDITAFNENNDNFIYRILLNPTVTGTFTYADLANSGVQIAVSDLSTPATVTGGVEIGSGVVLADSTASANLQTALKIGTSIAGVKDEIVLSIQPITAGADIFATMSWRELI